MRGIRNIRSFSPELDAELFSDLKLTEEPYIEVNRNKQMRPGRGAGSSCNACRVRIVVLLLPGGSLRSPPLISFRPAGANYVTDET